MSLSPEERAEKLMQDFNTAHWSKHKEMIAAQIREVEEIAADRNYKEPDQARWFRHGFKEGFNAAKEKAASIVKGEIEIYEEQAKRVTPARLKKIQKRWLKLKDIVNRIRQMEMG